MDPLDRIERLPPPERNVALAAPGVREALQALPKVQASTWLTKTVAPPATKVWADLLHAIDADWSSLKSWLLADADRCVAACVALQAFAAEGRMPAPTRESLQDVMHEVEQLFADDPRVQTCTLLTCEAYGLAPPPLRCYEDPEPCGVAGRTAAELAAMDFDEIHALSVAIDWRSEDDIVVGAIASCLPDPDALTCNVPDSDDAPLFVEYEGHSYRVPLTMSGSDRYVTLCSLAVILEGRHRIYHLDDGGCDTHSFITIEESVAAELEANPPDWMRDVEKLELGVDGFSGLEIPYLGNEGNNPRFAEQRAALEATHEKMKARVESMLSGSKPWWKFW